MKNLLTFIAIISFVFSGFSQITSAEYFVDTDPGVGSAIALSITQGVTIDEDFTIPTASLANGLHVLHIRAKGTNDVWSLYKRTYFYIQNTPTIFTPQNIVESEYFIDTDPGIGNAIALTITQGMTIDEDFVIPTTSLANGLHVLHIRVKDDDNTWSLYKRAYFYIQNTSTIFTPQNIVEAEYFIDTDSGVGSANVLSVTQGMTVSELFAIPTTGLTEGLHVLHIRVKDDDNTWSLYKRAYFYRHPINSTTTSTPIIAVEYFFDTDPGVGSATDITVTEGFTIDEDLVIQVPVAMTDGDHYLFLRVQDQDGTWSLYKRALFTADSTVSVEEFPSDDFKVYPNPTENRIYMDFKNYEEYAFVIYDISGKEIFQQKVLQQTNTFDFSKYASGIYILKIKEIKTNKVQHIKIIKS